MFIRNCNVKKDEDLRYRKQEELSNKQKKKMEFRAKMQQKKRAKQGLEQEEPIVAEEPASETTAKGSSPFEQADNIYYEDEHLYEPEIYHPVECSVCSTPLGVIDPDEIIHFYHVIPAEA